MKNRLLLLSSLLALASCGDDEYTRPVPPPRSDSIDISEVVVKLPDSPGLALIERACVPCHSLRYIEMQPALTKKAWEKTLTKMIKNFGAPVRDSVEGAEILRYLVAIKGKKE